MHSGPAADAANPPFLFLDSDCLIQLLLSGATPILRALRNSFGVQVAILPVVEAEVDGFRRYGDRIPSALKKAIGNGAIVVMDDRALRAHFVSQGQSAASAAAIVEGTLNAGDRYYTHVDAGEAYSLALSNELGFPLVSQDFSARRTLKGAGLPVPEMVLRVLDLVIFGVQSGSISVEIAERIRSEIEQAYGEYLPKEFRKVSFQHGVAKYEASLVDQSKAPIGPLSARALALRRRA